MGRGLAARGEGTSAHHLDPALVLGADIGDGEDERVQANHDHGEEEAWLTGLRCLGQARSRCKGAAWTGGVCRAP